MNALRPSNARPGRTPRRGESGSAYVVALLALLILTFLALALVFVTQTEVQLGSNQRTVSRTFYSAETGLAAATARVLTKRAYEPFRFIQNEVRVGNQRVADEIRVSLVAPIAMEPCDWCPVNDDGFPSFYKVNHAMTIDARRIAWQDNGQVLPPANPDRVLSSRTVSVMYEFQPWQEPPPEAAGTQAQLQQVRF
jgi:Tfp pilus assembly protein PilX